LTLVATDATKERRGMLINVSADRVQ
jgi:hypothetical protein